MSKIIDKLANQIARDEPTEFDRQSRRLWLQNLGLVSATGAVMWACGSSKKDDATASTSTENPKADAGVIKTAMELENEAINLYTAAAGLSIWTSDTDKAVKSIAVAFAAHHTAHFATLKTVLDASIAKDASITAFTPAQADATGYVTAATTAGADLSSVKGVLRLAAGKEAYAAQIYLAQVNVFTTAALRTATAEHGGDEAGHYGVLRAALFALYGDTVLIADGSKVIPSSVTSGFDNAIKA